MKSRDSDGPLMGAGIVLGVGLGGFLDGIVLHQLLQWHNVLSSVVVPNDLVTLKYNMVFDGFFHAITWTVTTLGVGLLWRASRRTKGSLSGQKLVGSMLAGWGLFNLVEGLVDHQILGLHHVRPGANERAWDIGFLVLGLLLIAAGRLLVRLGPHGQEPHPTEGS